MFSQCVSAFRAVFGVVVISREEQRRASDAIFLDG